MNDETDDAWAQALAEQQAAPAAKGAGAADDWAAALAEQTAAARPAGVAQPAAAQVFQQISEEPRAAAGLGIDLDRIKNIPVQLTAELGRTRITINNLLQLSQGSVVELDGVAGQPLDLFVNGYLIAQGEVVVVNDRYGIRVTDIVVPSERIQKLARS